MKKLSKILAVILACVLLMAAVPAAFAASYECAPGRSVTVTFNVSGTMGKIMGISNLGGSVISISDPDGIIDSYSQNSPKTSLAGQYGSGTLLYYGADAVSFSQPYTFKIKSDAQVGQKCTVTFTNYEVTDADGNLVNGRSISHTITVKSASTGGTSGSQEPEVKVDTTELQKQITAAEALTRSEYTADSWSALESALSAGRSALKSSDQAKINTAASNLAAAIGALVKMDYSRLEQALTDVEGFLDSEELADLWLSLLDAFSRGQELMTSGDQAAVDACAAEINEILAQMKAQLEELRTPVIEQVEVPVEVEPSYPFCNIPMHKVWPILCFVFLAVIIALVVYIVILKRKGKRVDSVPLVTYDIDDDF